jgi:hypothetical protein
MEAEAQSTTHASEALTTSSTKKVHKMPSLLHFVWQPHKKTAHERAKTVARRMSFKGTIPTPDDPTPASRSNTREFTRPVSDPGQPQLNRAQQKSLKRRQKANDSKASSSSRLTPMSPSHCGSSVQYGHGPEHHQGMPIVPISARFGYLEHSGRALHLGMLRHLYLDGSHYPYDKNRIETPQARTVVHDRRVTYRRPCILLGANPWRTRAEYVIISLSVRLPSFGASFSNSKKQVD